MIDGLVVCEHDVQTDRSLSPVEGYVRVGFRLVSAAESSDRDAIPSFGNTR